MFPVSSHFRDYIFYKTRNNLASEAQKTYLSFLWWLIDPILSMIIYYIVFSFILQRGTENFVAFLLIGILTWQWFASSVSISMGAMQNASDVISKLSFPKIVLPSVTVLTVTFKFLITFVILQGFLYFYGIEPSIHVLGLLPLLVIQFVLLCGASYLSCLLTTYIPDFKYVIPNLLRFGLFLSGIFYSVERLPEEYQRYFDFNPMAVLISSYRDVLMYQRWPDVDRLLPVVLGAGLLYLLMCAAYRRLDSAIPRVLMRA